MTQEEILNIKPGDVIWTDKDKWIIRFNPEGPLRHSKHLVLRPNKFYTVLMVEKTNKGWIKATIDSELGNFEVILYKESIKGIPASIPTNWVRTLGLIKEEDYLQISSMEYFV